MNKGSNKARVLLLNPPTAAVSTEALLNLAYLAAALRKAGHEARIVDATAPYRRYTARDVETVVSEFRPHFIGVTLTITYIAQTYEYLKGLRKMGAPIVAGGPHANGLPEEVLDNGADIVAIGEGEETVVELAEHFAGSRELAGIDGLCYRGASGRPHYSRPRKLIPDLDAIPFPDFGDFPIRNYTGSDDVNSNPIFWSVFTSRGCPFNCTFCSSHNVFGRVARMRSAANIFEEVRGLVERFGVDKIAFQDDEILCSKKRFLEFCDLVSASGMKLRMSIRTRIDSVDREVLERAKDIGLTRISFGIESWNDDTLKKINKMYDVATIQRRFKAIEEAAFPHISFNNIIGFPWETEEHLKKNLEEISRLPESVSFLSPVCTPLPYPKTALYDEYHEKFGFTGWWLDPAKHPRAMKDGERPFFMLFAFMSPSLYRPDIFWNYSARMKRAIERFSWGVFKLSARRHYGPAELMLVVSLCRASYFFWKVSPRLERALFRGLFNEKIMSLRKKFLFTAKN